jgi:dolichol-phosphate mannosyltransferase
VVAPCYNEEAGIPELHRRLAAACRSILAENYEIVLIDDGSRDGTWNVINQLAQVDRKVVAVHLARNHGHQLAVTAGLALSRGERVLIIDADLQDPPELIGDMMRLMDEGADVVYGQRRTRASDTVFKRATAALFYRLLRRISDVDIPIDTGDFRLMSRRVVDALQIMPEQQRFIRGMVSWIGFKQVPILYDRAERVAGSTQYPLGKMIRLAIDALTSFSIAPLRFASHLGLAMAPLAVILLAYSLVSWLSGHAVAGWTSLMATVVILGSFQLVVLGVLGEYIGRLLIESKRRPLFVIDEVTSSQHSIRPPVNLAQMSLERQQQLWAMLTRMAGEASTPSAAPPPLRSSIPPLVEAQGSL